MLNCFVDFVESLAETSSKHNHVHVVFATLLPLFNILMRKKILNLVHVFGKKRHWTLYQFLYFLKYGLSAGIKKMYVNFLQI